MVIRWLELVTEWRGRLASYRRALETNEPAGVEGALLRMRVRVLTFLVTRYGDGVAPKELEDDGWPPVGLFDEDDAPSSRPRRFYNFTPPPPVAEVSKLHPPRSAAELRFHLKVMRQRLPDRGLWCRWFWRGGW